MSENKKRIESLNRVELIGFVGAANVNKVGDTQVVRFSVATDYGYNDKGGNPVIETTWHSVVAWEGENVSKDTIAKIKKYEQVRVVGRLRQYRFTNADGSERTGYEVVANEVSVTGDKLF